MKETIFLVRGASKLKKGHFDDALKIFSDVIQLNRTSPVGWAGLGESKRMLGRYEEAIKDFDEAIRLDPKSVSSWDGRGESKRMLGRYQEAIKDYDEAIRLEPKSEFAWGGRGNSKQMLGRHEEAIKDYDEAIRLYPKSVIAWQGRGISKQMLGRYEEAIKGFDEAIRLDPKSAFAWQQRGESNRMLGRHEEAIKDYDEAIRLDTKSVIAWRGRGISKQMLGRYEEAIKDYDEAIRLDPKSVIAWQLRGKSNRMLGRLEEAIKDYDEAIRLDPECNAAWLGRGLAKRKLGRKEDALKDLNEAVRLEPKYQSYLNEEKQEKKMISGANEVTSASVEKIPKKTELNSKESTKDAEFARGNKLFREGKYRQAIDCFNEILSIDSDYQPALERIKVASLLYQIEKLLADANEVSKSGEYEKVLELCEQALKLPNIEKTEAINNLKKITKALQELKQKELEKKQKAEQEQKKQKELAEKLKAEEAQKKLLDQQNQKLSESSVPSSPSFGHHQIRWSELQMGELLGKGGFGEVYKAKWHGKNVAVKTLHSITLTEQDKKIFNQEADVMASCNFPHVIRLYGICTETGRHAMVMELMPKGSLYEVLRKPDEVLPWVPLRWQISLDVARGLSYLHGKQILHRDLKSLNVLLDENYQAKISDFGLAKTKMLSSNSSSSKSGNKGLAGSGRWSAPEVLDPEGNGEATRASDIYSLGMVFWEIASRKLPYEETQKEIAVGMKILSGKKEKIPSETPDFYGHLILSMWESPEKRPFAQRVIEILVQNSPSQNQNNLAEKSWHFDGEIPKGDKDYYLIPGGEKDYRKAVAFYSHHGYPGFEIQSVEIIYNPELNRGFFGKMRLLQKRANNPAFKPKWETENNPEWRREVNQLCRNLSQPFNDADFPDVQLLPLWHGTRPEIMQSIFTTGYANLATTDSGFFGKGLYSAYEAEYSQRVYSKGALILNWVAFFSAYPVIDGDMDKLTGAGNYANYDAHFVPVVPQNPKNPNETIYIPTKSKQKSVYTEVVVFEAAQCLPRYVVRLQAVLLNSHGMFRQTHAQIDLFTAAKDVYQNYLSKPYTLKTHMQDWEYVYGGVTVHRPNHGLALVLRKASYVPFVIQFYVEFNREKLNPEAVKELQDSIPEIQLALLFSLTGRQNDCSNNDNAEDYFRFRHRSAEIFEAYVKDKKFMISLEHMAHYCDAIKAFDYNKSFFHVVMTIAHMIDTLRCFHKPAYESIMATVANYVGAENAVKLKDLAYLCNLKTGDRIMGMEPSQNYQGRLFIECSQNVEKCVESIRAAVGDWEKTMVPVIQPCPVK